jgi:hypothetical protein
MGGTLVDTIFILIAAKPWLLTAACDFVTTISAVGIAVLILGRRPGSPASVPTLRPAATEAPDAEIRNAVRTPASSPAYTTVLPADTSGSRRSAVESAVAAMERWESTYRGTGRGLEDLTRLARKRQQGVSRELMKDKR